MKTRRNTYFIIGSFLIIINLLVDIVDIRDLLNRIFEHDSFSIGFFIGSQFLLFIGIVLLRFGFKIHKRIKSVDDNNIEQSINQIGKS